MVQDAWLRNYCFVLVVARYFSLLWIIQLGPILSLIQWVRKDLSLGVKWPGHKTKHSLSLTTEVKNVFSYTFNLFMVSCMPRDFTYSFCLKLLIKFWYRLGNMDEQYGPTFQTVLNLAERVSDGHGNEINTNTYIIYNLLTTLDF